MKNLIAAIQFITIIPMGKAGKFDPGIITALKKDSSWGFSIK